MENRGVSDIRARIVVFAEPPVLRYGLVRLLSQELDLQVCGEADHLEDLLHRVDAAHPDLTVVGLPTDGKAHLVMIEQLKAKHPEVKVLAATLHEEPNLVGRILQAGAHGYIHWSEPLPHIVEAVRNVLRGDLHVTASTMKSLLRSVAEGKPLDGNLAHLLSQREWDVFTMIGQGLTTQQIARKLDLSPRTIETHRKKIKLKLGLQNASQLSRCAFQWVHNEAN